MRADQVHARAAEADLRHQRVLPQERRRDGGVVLRLAGGGADHARDRRAVQRRHRAGQAAAAEVPDARRRGAGPDAAAAARRRAAAPLRRPDPGRGAGARRVRARRDRRDGLRVVLPDRLGLRQLREAERGRGRPRPRLGRRLDRRVRPQHHRSRSARQRPALRALPQPGAQVDAGHRHRLLGPRPRAGDPLRAGEVRPRVGGPDHHLRQDGPAGRHPRRGAGARLRLRDGRPRREADPRADHGPQPELRRLPEAGPGPAQGRRRRPRRQAHRRRRAGPRGDRPQQLDPRRRRGDRRPAARRDRAAAARRGSRRRRRSTARTASRSASTRS